MRFVSAVMAMLFVLMAPLFAHAAGKVALVIGNGAYQHANPLPNPTNDATDMTAALQNLGFTVIGGNDLDYAAMGAKIGEFEDAAREADVTLFFYAGHGLQVNGRNFLVPVSAKLDRESSLQFEAIDAETVLRSMAGPGKTAIALLDACRDNPLSRSFARSLGKSRSTAVAQGLAVPSISGGGMLIGFATAPGDVAADGEGRNSPFTTALLKNIATPGLEIQQLMTRVKADVFNTTKEAQEPWHNSSLRSEIYLGGDLKAPEPPPAQPPAENTTSAAAEWALVKDTTNPAVLDAFVAAHSDNALFVALAEDRKAMLQLQAKQQDDKVAILESLKLPELPELPVLPKLEEQPSAKEEIKKEARRKILEALNPDNAEVPQTRSSQWSLDSFFDFGKAANDGQTTYALLGAPVISLAAPSRNPGTKNRSMSLQKMTGAASLDALLASDSTIPFNAENASSCRLDWIDRCPFLPQDMVQGLASAMAAKGMDINGHSGNYYMLNRINGSDSYLLSNAPDFRDGTVAVIAAIVAPDLTIQDLYGFDLSSDKLGLEAGAPESGVEVTGAATDGQNLYISFDGSHRCTDKVRKFGFIAKFGTADRAFKWVSPFNVSDANLLLANGRLLSANGGSCVDDFLYEIDTETGQIKARAKLPSAIERMDQKDGLLTLELYDGAGVYQLP